MVSRNFPRNFRRIRAACVRLLLGLLLTCVPVAGAAFQETSLEPADEAPENLIPATGEERAESRRVKELALELGALREKIEEEPDLRQRYTIYRRLMTMKRPQADIELIVHQAQRAWAARPPDAATLRDALYASSCGVHDRRIVQQIGRAHV